mmetsp:Transcript_60774/g.100370  ORF Transcript_60774/g.100370 Transcript_60774/m.100370 type:complete len:293 (-) Transcript_60774:1768-2646(-)
MSWHSMFITCCTCCLGATIGATEFAAIRHPPPGAVQVEARPVMELPAVLLPKYTIALPFGPWNSSLTPTWRLASSNNTPLSDMSKLRNFVFTSANWASSRAFGGVNSPPKPAFAAGAAAAGAGAPKMSSMTDAGAAGWRGAAAGAGPPSRSSSPPPRSGAGAAAAAGAGAAGAGANMASKGSTSGSLAGAAGPGPRSAPISRSGSSSGGGAAAAISICSCTCCCARSSSAAASRMASFSCHTFLSVTSACAFCMLARILLCLMVYIGMFSSTVFTVSSLILEANDKYSVARC